MAVTVLVVAGAAAWFGAKHWNWHLGGYGVPKNADADHIDVANEGLRIRVSGKLAFDKLPHDAQLGITADGAVLLRHVEMYQWNERCTPADCTYEPAWSEHHVDASKFRTPAGHENPPFPFSDAHFVAGDIRLGAFAPDVDLLTAQVASQPVAVKASALPPNLAATFRDASGTLYAGDDPEHPKVGALRVSFEMIPAGAASVVGVQRGKRLAAD